jgi:hypothetical protein
VASPLLEPRARSSDPRLDPVDERLALGTPDGEVASPEARDVQMALDRALSDPESHVVLRRGDEFVQVAGDVLEWGDGDSLRRTRLDGPALRRRFLEFFEGRDTWGRGLTWENVDVSSEARRSASVLWLWIGAGLIGLVLLALRWVEYFRPPRMERLAAHVSRTLGSEWRAMVLGTGLGSLLLVFAGDALLRRRASASVVGSRRSIVAVVLAAASSLLAALFVTVVCEHRSTSCRFSSAALITALLAAIVIGTRTGPTLPLGRSVLAGAVFALVVGTAFGVL